MKILLPILVLALFFCTSCDMSSEHIQAEGTVTYVNLEGGFWGITAGDGRKFDPVNLPDGFKQDNLKVKVTLKPRDDLAGMHMWGQIVEVVEIKKVRD
jgi:inhibitor of cysteine peptidase